MAQARTIAQEIQLTCDSVTRTATITESVMDATAAACIAQEAVLGDTEYNARGYPAALASVNAAAVALGASTYNAED
jgi:hypothetical protein